jgi:beta-N-acetylhexosaminidase
MVKKVFLYFLMVFGVFIDVVAQPDKNTWVDSVFNSLSVDQKIGQLFMVPVPLQANEAVLSKIQNQIKSKEIGGVIFGPTGPVQQAKITSRLQGVSDIPLLVAQEALQGVGQHRDSTLYFPSASLIGATRNDSMAYVLGVEIARQMKILGVHMNVASFAEVANTNFKDSTIYHSFGQNNKRVALKAVAFMKGLQDNGVLAIAKNFQLNGATVLEIQDELPVIEASVDSVKSWSYHELFENGLMGFMPTSSSFPILYKDNSQVKRNDFDAETISLLFTADWLKRTSNYQGLTLVNLKTKKEVNEKNTGDDELIAFQAGNDVLITSEEIGPAIRKIKRLIKKEERFNIQLTACVRKILAAKFDAGLWRKPVLNTDNVISRLNAPQAQLVREKLYEAAVTIIQDTENTVPISTLENRHFIYINTTSEPLGEFYHYLSKYVHTAYFGLNDNTNVELLADSLKQNQVIIVGVFPQTSEAVIEKLSILAQRMLPSHKIILCDFGNVNFLHAAPIPGVTLITAYANVPEALRAVPQVIYGGLSADGILPFAISTQTPEGTGLETTRINRLMYSIPEDADMSSGTLEEIETVVNEAITTRATPGCQILVARNGKVVYDKSFGTLNYNPADSVTEDIIYDLASLTKVSATLQAVMFLYEKGLIDLNKKLSHYLPELKNTNKKDITIIEMLTHQAGLVPFIPMWTETVKDAVFLPQYYSRIQNEKYPLQVSPDLYAAPILRDSVWYWIEASKLEEKPARTPYSYRYSDLGFLLLQRLAEKIFNQSIDDFLAQNLYEPLGAYTTGYTPLKRFSAQRIAPTEDDKIFRKTHIAGTVHDERAAMMGGVAGHAGLFSNATDLAKLGQMLLQGGTYGGYQYYKPETVNLFTAKQFDRSRRGLGWDKPVQSDWNSPTSLKASPKTFGHTGFTGTCIWIDPEFNLVYVFLSNRVYPDRSGKLITNNIRSRIQDIIYESIFNYCQYDPQ